MCKRIAPSTPAVHSAPATSHGSAAAIACSVVRPYRTALPRRNQCIHSVQNTTIRNLSANPFVSIPRLISRREMLL